MACFLVIKLLTLKKMKMLPINFLILGPKKISSYFDWLGPLLARLIVGYVFMLTGLAKLQNLEVMIENFASWGIPFPAFTTPFVACWECFGGLFIMFGFMTRICGGALSIVMIVAIISAKLSDIDSLETLLGFEEAIYFALFSWLAICGAGKASVDHLIEKKFL
jgi:putative oxidoreductase